MSDPYINKLEEENKAVIAENQRLLGVIKDLNKTISKLQEGMSGDTAEPEDKSPPKSFTLKEAYAKYVYKGKEELKKELRK